MNVQKILQASMELSLGSKIMCLAVFVFYLLGKIPLLEDNLVVTPALILPAHMKVWTLITAPLYENQWFLVPCSIGVIFASGVLLEPLWGMKEFLIFQALSGCGGVLIMTCLYLFLYMVSSSETILFAALHGVWTLLGGNLVAVKQINPDLTVISVPQIRAKFWLPYTLLVSAFLPLTGFVSWSAPVMIFMGAMVGWVYLRFYQPHADSRRGDLADNFAFATFFPEILQTSISHLSEVVYGILVKVKICPKWVRSYDLSSSSAVTIKLPGMDSADAERRKQKALRALNERLSKVESPTSETWPSMEDGDQDPSNTDPPSTTSANVDSKPDSVVLTVEDQGTGNEDM